MWRQNCGPATCSAENWEELLPGAGRSVALIRSVGACRRSRVDYVSALSEARPHKKRDRNRGLGRAFDKAVRRKPLAGAANAVYGN